MPRESSIAVLEAAALLLHSGVPDVPRIGGVNVKQARSLFHLADWIQKKKTAERLNGVSSVL